METINTNALQRPDTRSKYATFAKIDLDARPDLHQAWLQRQFHHRTDGRARPDHGGRRRLAHRLGRAPGATRYRCRITAQGALPYMDMMTPIHATMTSRFPTAGVATSSSADVQLADRRRAHDGNTPRQPPQPTRRSAPRGRARRPRHRRGHRRSGRRAARPPDAGDDRDQRPGAMAELGASVRCAALKTSETRRTMVQQWLISTPRRRGSSRPRNHDRRRPDERGRRLPEEVAGSHM